MKISVDGSILNYWGNKRDTFKNRMYISALVCSEEDDQDAEKQREWESHKWKERKLVTSWNEFQGRGSGQPRSSNQLCTAAEIRGRKRWSAHERQRVYKHHKCVLTTVVLQSALMFRAQLMHIWWPFLSSPVKSAPFLRKICLALHVCVCAFLAFVWELMSFSLMTKRPSTIQPHPPSLPSSFYALSFSQPPPSSHLSTFLLSYLLCLFRLPFMYTLKIIIIKKRIAHTIHSDTVVAWQNYFPWLKKQKIFGIKRAREMEGRERYRETVIKCEITQTFVFVCFSNCHYTELD